MGATEYNNCNVSSSNNFPFLPHVTIQEYNFSFIQFPPLASGSLDVGNSSQLERPLAQNRLMKRPASNDVVRLAIPLCLIAAKVHSVRPVGSSKTVFKSLPLAQQIFLRS